MLLAGREECGDAALELGACADRQTALANERAALVDLARYAEQLLAGVLGGEGGDGFAAAGVDGGKTAHRVARTKRVARECEITRAADELQRALHGRKRPGGIAVFVGKRAALARRETVEHHAQKGKQGGLAGLIRRFDDIEPIFKCQRAAVELSEGCRYAAELQANTPPADGRIKNILL